MLSLQEALDFAASSSSCGAGARDMGMDIITCGFTPWGPDSCPTLDQVMASRPAPAREEADEEVVEEERLRQQRRRVSNRLSARRSRERKQQRLEELRGTAARLRAEKQELEARLQALARHGLVVRCQNARLRAEAAALACRLREARRLLALRRLAQALPPPPMPMPMMMMPLQQQAVAGVAPAAPMGLASLMT